LTCCLSIDFRHSWKLILFLPLSVIERKSNDILQMKKNKREADIQLK